MVDYIGMVLHGEIHASRTMVVAPLLSLIR